MTFAENEIFFWPLLLIANNNIRLVDLGQQKSNVFSDPFLKQHFPSVSLSLPLTCEQFLNDTSMSNS